jgi:hypothetical protein
MPESFLQKRNRHFIEERKEGETREGRAVPFQMGRKPYLLFSSQFEVCILVTSLEE